MKSLKYILKALASDVKRSQLSSLVAVYDRYAKHVTKHPIRSSALFAFLISDFLMNSTKRSFMMQLRVILILKQQNQKS